jgi:hypothetical protein
MLILNFMYPLRCLRVPPVEYHCSIASFVYFGLLSCCEVHHQQILLMLQTLERLMYDCALVSLCVNCKPSFIIVFMQAVFSSATPMVSCLLSSSLICSPLLNSENYRKSVACDGTVL